MWLCVLASSNLAAQNKPVTLQFKDAPLERVLEAIEKQSDYLFVYGNNIDVGQPVSVTAEAMPLKDLLDRVFANTGIHYTISNRSIVLTPAAKTAPGTMQQVSGRVTDKDGNPIIGALVAVKGSNQATVTGGDGRFTLSFSGPPSETYLVVSYFGFEKREIPVGNQTSLRIELTESVVEMTETVVTALGIKRAEKALSYNVQTIGSEEITGVKDANFVNALNGKLAGITINATSSGTGGASKVVMRGSRSINKSSNALFVVDGVLLNNPTRETSSLSDSPFESSGTTDFMADINPEDIESVSVLTGAAAAALYGSNAANGAIIINTKRGAEGATTLTFTQNTEFMTAFVTPAFQNRYGTSPGADQRNKSWGAKLNDYNSMGYDPARDYLQTGIATTETVAFSTGTQRNQTYASASALNSEGIIPNNRYDRYNFTFRNTTKFLDDKMTLDVGSGYVLQHDVNMINQGVYSNPLSSAYLYPRGNDWENVRMFERWDPQRKISTQFWDMDPGEYVLQNPYWINYRNLRENTKNRYTLNARVNYDVLDWLSVSARANVDYAQENGKIKNYAGTNTQLTESSQNGLYGETSSVNKQVYADVIADVHKSFGEKWSLNAVLGASVQDTRYDARSISGPIRDGSVEGEVALPPNVFNLMQISNVMTKKTLLGWREQMQSLFTSAEVGFDRTYYLTATLRTDWPSQLAGPESVKRSFTYPSVGLSVILSEMFAMPKQISYLKLRSSYASVGLAFSRFLAYPTLAWDGSQWSEVTHKPVNDLRPEFTHSFEAGVTARLFRHVNLDFTFYNTRTIDQVINPGISPGSGYESMYVQQGIVQNRGIELGAGYSNKWRDFAWETNFTFSANRNRIVKLSGGIVNEDTGEITTYSYLSMGGLGESVKFLLQEGGTLGDLYSSIDLVRDRDGKIYVDQNGNVFRDTGNKDIATWTKLGSVFPKANLGWRNQFSWRGFNLGFLVTARLGGICYSRTQATLDFYGVSEASAAARDRGGVAINGGDLIDAYNWYSVVGASDGVPQYYTYDATNVRLQEASIGYTIPRKWLWNLCDATVSVVGRNLFMIYSRAPFDPESTATASDNFYQGIDYFMMPSTRNIGFSVRLKF